MALDLAQERQPAHAYLDQLPAAQLTALRTLLLFRGAIGVLAGAALPAARAVRLDPMEVLRHD